MSRTKPILVLCLVFIAGLAVGVIGTRIVVRNAIQKITRNPDLMRDRIERDIAARLKLSSEQQSQLHVIVSRSQREIQDLRRQFQPQFVGIMDRTEKEVSEILNAEQRSQFDELLKEKRPLWRPTLPR